MVSPDVRLTDDKLVLLRPLDQMRGTTRRALTKWLWAHQVTPSVVAIGLPIERDAHLGSLAWREQNIDGSVTRRWRYAGRCEDRLWPAPFPPEVSVEALDTGADIRQRKFT